MPREQITYPPIVTENEGTPNERHVTREFTGVSVGWNRAGWVQVNLDLPTEALKKVLESYTNDNRGDAVVYSDVLSRTDINKMIRALRKARDQAYGADA